MKTEIYINRIPSEAEAFQIYINATDDAQKAKDKYGFTIYPVDENGKRNYNDNKNNIEVKDKGTFMRWDWTESESKQWSGFRKEYNELYKKYNSENKTKDVELIKQLNEVINRFIAFDKQNLLIQRVSDNCNTTGMQFELFNIKQDLLEFVTPLRTISLKYEKQVPLNSFEKTFCEKYVALHHNTTKITERIETLCTNIKQMQSTFPLYWEQLPIVKDKADKATNSICIPSPIYKSFPSAVVSFRIPTLEEQQQNMDEFNRHNMALYKEIADMYNQITALEEELRWVENIWDNDKAEYTGEPLFEEIEKMTHELFDIENRSLEVMSVDDDHQEFLGSWGCVTEASDKANEAWEEMIAEQGLMMKVYNAFVNFINDKFNNGGETAETTATAIEPTDDNPDDLRAETISRYKASVDNNSNTYFDVQDWHIIIDNFDAKHDDKNAVIAIEAGLAQHPEHEVLLVRKARKVSDTGDYKKALELIKQAEDQGNGAGHHPNLFYIKAYIYGQLQSPELAIPLYKKLAAYKTEEMTWWRNHSYDCLLEIYGEQKNYKECIKISKEAIEDRKDDERLFSNLALYHSLNNDLEEAEKVCKYFLKKHPDSPICINRLGNTYEEMKQYDKAIECFDKAYAIDNGEHYGSLFSKGKVLMELKKYNEAIVCFELCLWHYKLAPDYHISAAQCYEKLGYLKLAINHYRSVLIIDPDNRETIQALKLLTNESVPLSKLN